jgi:hypothetical protein
MNASKLDIVPAKLDFEGALPAEPPAAPGKTQLI